MALFKHKSKEDDRVSSMVEHPKLGDRVVDVIVIALCLLVAFCSVIPMWHVLMSSFSDGRLLMGTEGLVVWPVGGFHLEGYTHLFKNSSIVDGYTNTIFYTVTQVGIGFLIAAMGGYAISRQTKLKTPMILFLTATMLFGGGMVPVYMVINALGWVETPLALIMPGCTNGMFCIMMMNAFNAVPGEMYEAARIDGAGHFRTDVEGHAASGNESGLRNYIKLCGRRLERLAARIHLCSSEPPFMAVTVGNQPDY